MKTQVNSTDYNVFVDENGNITAELKRKSLKLSDIIMAQEGQTGFFIYNDRITDHKLSGLSRSALTDQIKELTARKAMLYGQLLRIADYANGDWEQVQRGECYNAVKNTQGVVAIFKTFYFIGAPSFKSEELAKQAYEDNKELFDEFLSL